MNFFALLTSIGIKAGTIPEYDPIASDYVAFDALTRPIDNFSGRSPPKNEGMPDEQR